MIDINTIQPGQLVAMGGEQGTVARVDLDDHVVWVEFLAADGTPDEIDLDPSEPDLVLV